MKPDYGIDAPNVIRNLLLSGIALIILSILFPLIKIGELRLFTNYIFMFLGLFLILEAVLMILYSKFGKFRHRDRMLKMIEWMGDEKVLDVGTGKGLLMLGAAKKLTTGKSFGVDIWEKNDLSGNTFEQVMKNADVENVTDKIQVKNEDVRKLSFEDNYFDAVLSNLCLHNISSKEGRAEACREIVRVLKPGGKAVISDFKHLHEYSGNFRNLGMKTELSKNYLFDTFPTLRIVSFVKNNSSLES